MTSPAPTLVVFQHGHFAEAHAKAQSGAPETYRDQYASVAYVAGLAAAYNVTTLSICDAAHDMVLAPNLRSIGVPLAQMNAGKADSILAELAPDLMVLRAPYSAALRYAAAHATPSLPCFADIFQTRSGLRGLKDTWRFAALRRLLSGAHIPCVANHSLNASRALVDVIGLPPQRVVPWDWTRVTPAPHGKDHAGDLPRAFYAGVLSEAKGVGDCLDAIRLLKDQGLILSLSLAGKGTEDMPIEAWQNRAQVMGISDQVTFLGLIPNAQVRARMAAHDMVLVPSRHTYPEGLPNTIYEGLASRSPLVISDHPAFAGRLTHGQGCVQFKAGDPSALARAMSTLCAQPALYSRLSHGADLALNRLYIGLEWSDLVQHFLDDPSDATGWVLRHSLSAQQV
ncbi:glycosyltransferase involved in cell wall biosynthesis [Litoreibacter meonggei]|uniref:Glycosyltransferase involved in cell wall biosynthesis n=1 Tax=Litoreibacter meonggei TaxID=1049199 RepID=A0A497VHR1_9RHOB|nr:glycosyltransferase [Litoreibacter meonggei]RLJ36223.1 glycosyltransferase involved in cell wall biosynthesis [Litoreibacter meonggei]